MDRAVEETRGEEEEKGGGEGGAEGKEGIEPNTYALYPTKRVTLHPTRTLRALNMGCEGCEELVHLWDSRFEFLHALERTCYILQERIDAVSCGLEVLEKKRRM